MQNNEEHNINYEYITEYMLNDRNARVAIRYLIENKITGEELLNAVAEIEKN